MNKYGESARLEWTRLLRSYWLAALSIVTLIYCTFLVRPAIAYEINTPELDAVVLTEEFEAGSLPPFLQHSHQGTPAIAGNGSIFFPGRARPQGRRDLAASRSYVRTVASDFSSVSFIADITVHLTPGTPYDTAFFGLGTAEPTADFWGEPRQGVHIYARAAPSSFANGYFGVTRERVENPVPAIQPGAGDGTHRLRMVWDAELQTATFKIHRGYRGGRFVASSTLGPVEASDIGLDSSNSSIFFGAAENTRFDNLIIAVADGIALSELDDFAELTGGRAMQTQSTHGGYGQPPRHYREPMCNSSRWQRFKALFRVVTCSNLDMAADQCDGGLLSIADVCRCPGGLEHGGGNRCVPRSTAGIDRRRWAAKGLDDSRGQCHHMNCWKYDDVGRDHLDVQTSDLNYVTRLSEENPPRDGRYIYVLRKSDNDLYLRPFDRDQNDRRFMFPGNCRALETHRRWGQYPCSLANGQRGTYLHTRHSQLNGGWDPVWCAGEMRVEDGQICLVNNESGHFKPPQSCLAYVKETLSKWGVPMAERVIFDDLRRANAGKTCWQALHWQRDDS